MVLERRFMLEWAVYACEILINANERQIKGVNSWAKFLCIKGRLAPGRSPLREFVHTERRRTTCPLFVIKDGVHLDSSLSLSLSLSTAAAFEYMAVHMWPAAGPARLPNDRGGYKRSLGFAALDHCWQQSRFSRALPPGAFAWDPDPRFSFSRLNDDTSVNKMSSR